MLIQVYLNEKFIETRFEDAPPVYRLAVTFQVSDDQCAVGNCGKPIPLLEHVFEQLNVGGDLVDAEEWTTRYRANGNRSLSTTDVVIVGETAFTVAPFGWETMSTDDLLDGINRYTASGVSQV